VQDKYTDDEFLLFGIKNQDNSAFQFLYKNYFGMIKELIRKNNGTTDDAKDIFQESIITVIEKLNDSPIILTSTFKTYFYSMCRLKWLKKIREKKKFIKLNEFDNLEIEDSIYDSDKEIKIEKLDMLTQLGQKCQEILRLFYYQRKSFEEIALMLEYSNADNAKVQKYKCIEQLKKKLKAK